MSGRRERDFLSRWSRLKREGCEPVADAEAATPPAEPDAREAPERSDAEILEAHGLADPDSLGPEDDVSGFMARTIPDRLRNRALRRLWLRDPVLANLDELVDYGEDYTDAATVVATLASAWQAGRGYLAQAPGDPEEPADRETGAAGEAPPPGGEADDAPADRPDGALIDTDAPLEDAPEPAPDAPEPDPASASRPAASADAALPEAAPQPRRRRMAFRV